MANHTSASDRAGDRHSAPHPSLDTWIDYHAGTLGREETQRLQGHLAACRKCLDLVLDLDAFADPAGPPTSGPADFERAAVWRGLEPRLARRGWPRVAALAASILLAVFGLSLWNGQQRALAELETRIVELSSPQADARILDLRPGARERSAGGADSTTELPVDSGPITLVLNLAEPASHDGYELEIVDADGDRAHHFTGLQPSELDNFFLSLPPGSLPAGEYQLVLSGVTDGRRDLLEIYPVRLR